MTLPLPCAEFGQSILDLSDDVCVQVYSGIELIVARLILDGYFFRFSETIYFIDTADVAHLLHANLLYDGVWPIRQKAEVRQSPCRIYVGQRVMTGELIATSNSPK